MQHNYDAIDSKMPRSTVEELLSKIKSSLSKDFYVKFSKVEKNK